MPEPESPTSGSRAPFVSFHCALEQLVHAHAVEIQELREQSQRRPLEPFTPLTPRWQPPWSPRTPRCDKVLLSAQPTPPKPAHNDHHPQNCHPHLDLEAMEEAVEKANGGVPRTPSAEHESLEDTAPLDEAEQEELEALRLEYAEVVGEPPEGKCATDAAWLQVKIEEARGSGALGPKKGEEGLDEEAPQPFAGRSKSFWQRASSMALRTSEGPAKGHLDFLILEAGQTEQSTMLETIINGSYFDIFVGIAILANCCVMMIQLQYTGYKAKVSLGMLADDAAWTNADDWFFVLEHVFNAVFVLELGARLAVMRSRLLQDLPSIFDALIVILSSIQVYILDPLDLDFGGANLTLFRMLRFVRFVRILRLVRVMKCFSELRVLVKTCISSFRALAWSMILLMLIMVMGGLFLCELLKDFITDETNDLKQRRWVFNYYGTALRAIYTLFEVTLAGCWPNYFRPLIEEVSGWYVIFSVVYISLVVFAVIRIITAIFLKETLQIAANDSEMMVNEQIKKKEGYIKKLETVFKAVDVDGRGKVNVTEFERIVMNPKVRAWLQVLELEVHDAESLFRLLDDGDGEVTYEEFLKGVMRLKGQARSIDVVGIMRASDKTLDVIRAMQAQMNTMRDEVDIMDGRVRDVYGRLHEQRFEKLLGQSRTG